MPANPASHTELPPHAQLVQMATAHWVSHILYVAAKLSLADHLASGAKRADELAAATKTHAPSLSRLHADTRTPRTRDGTRNPIRLDTAR